MSEINFDTSELDALADDLVKSARAVAVEGVMKRAAVNIKRTMKEDATGHRRLKGLPSKASYDIAATPVEVSIVVGFEKKGQGNLANIAAFGSRNNAPVMDITRGLRLEVPHVEKWLAKPAKDALP